MKQAARANSIKVTPAIEIPLDLLICFAARNRGDLGEGFQPPPTREAWHAVLADPGQRWYAIVDVVNQGLATVVIGLVVFSRWTNAPWRSAEIGFGLESAVVGHGVIQRAVPHLLAELLNNELARIEARVDPDNERATRALSMLGFRFEGHARGCLDGVDGRRAQEQWAIVTADISGNDGHADHGYDSTYETDRATGHA